MHVSLRNINLNLLPVLQALLKAGSVTGAAAALNLSQSAISDALGRLRDTFGDALLVRVGATMQLTPVALELVAPVDEICEAINQLLFRRVFDPDASDREFVVSCWDYPGMVLAGPLSQVLHAYGPRMRLRFVPDGNDLASRMANREVDFALLPNFAVEDMAPAPLRFRPLFNDNAMVIMATDHPLAERASLTREDMAPYPHVLFEPPESPAIAKRAQVTVLEGQAIEVAARTSHMALLPHLVVGTARISMVPVLFAALLPPNHKLISKPIDVSWGNVTIGMAWSPVLDTDPGHVWFRNLLQKLVPPMFKAESSCHSAEPGPDVLPPATSMP